MTGSPLVGVITALPVETTAVRYVLGCKEPGRRRNDPNLYTMAELGCGLVVSTNLVTTGNTSAADATAHLVRSFPGVRAVVMCGIALGVPRPEDPERDVRLGDIVVGSAGVIHYGHRRITDESVTLRGIPLPASPFLMRGVNEIRAAQLRGERPWETWLEPLPSLAYRRPAGAPKRGPEAVYGFIGSGDELLRSAARRDETARAHDLIAMEMEGAGVANSAGLGGRECLVIRGVSDYGDARKNDLWQPYASLTAAAYLRVLLDVLKPVTPQQSTPELLDLVKLMELVPSLQTPGDRDLVLRLMGPPVEGKVARDNRTRYALLSLAHACAQHPAGFDRLIAVLAGLEGEDSEPLRDLAAALSQ
ncbi:effector-associated domain 2-containing protein [Nonomuraea sp. H19]|uniref:effector-associated domain 2-containing protein n=1 Tax=Nonomuraea sp. H19 TaxID=3452206 RepID=UPI003F8BF34B